MTVEATRTSHRGPCVVTYPDGSRYTTETDMLHIRDIRETAIGPMDFGCSYILDTRRVELEAARPAPNNVASRIWKWVVR